MRYFALLMAGLLILACARWCFLPHRYIPRFRVRHMRLRLHLRLHPGRGHASLLELWLRWGRFAAFRRSARSRRTLSPWKRLRSPGEHSLALGRAHYGHRLRIPVEEHLLIMAPPRTGKTGLLARIILHYPGPVLSTTTKHDIYELTSGIRARRGPLHVFNPQGIGGVPSTFRWNPVAGCEDPAVAIRRADGFANAVSMHGTEDASFWSAKASSYLRALFHAASFAGGDMRTVASWALGSAEHAEDILAGNGAAPWAQELAELRGEAQKTAQTIKMVISRALSFMSDPALASSVLPGPDSQCFDIPSFLRERGTLYLIAESEYDDSPVAPLFAALAGEVHHVAAQIGQASQSRRLDPPLLMALDEIVQVCPIPLPIWLADSGGKGIQLIPVAHGEAQLRTRWHADGAQVVLDTCGVKVWLPGITDTTTLKTASDLCGQATFTERGHGTLREKGEDRTARHDVMTPDMIRQLPAGHALVIRGSLSPVIARLAAAWKDPAYKTARRAGTDIARLPAAQPVPARADARPARASHLSVVPDPGPAPGPRPEAGEPDARPSSYPWS
ncbi:MAG: type IV secretory system conjugative DNA transfer family protein [Streptosporangiaceae bacterium]